MGSVGKSCPGLLTLDEKACQYPGIFQLGCIDEEYIVDKEPIARGKFASVRLARHRKTNVLYAAKYIRRRRRAASLEGEARHEVAVLLLGRSDPNIVKLHQVFETRSEYIILLEFASGGDLQKLLDERGSLVESNVRNLLKQVLLGLKFLHERSIAHLDIKPQNLVLMGPHIESDVKLVDFGLSRLIRKDAELTQIMGTPDYVAPEVINFEPVGLATDMWSIGVLSYVFLSGGWSPFGGENDQETFVNITQGDFEFTEENFKDVSDLAKEFISSLLLKNPSERLTVAQSLNHPWILDIPDPNRLSQLSESDTVDSGYLTDHCNGSPPTPRASNSPTSYSIPYESSSQVMFNARRNQKCLSVLNGLNGLSSKFENELRSNPYDVYQSIPEEADSLFSRQDKGDESIPSPYRHKECFTRESRRQYKGFAHQSMNVLEHFQNNKKHKLTRRASLIIDDPRQQELLLNGKIKKSRNKKCSSKDNNNEFILDLNSVNYDSMYSPHVDLKKNVDTKINEHQRISDLNYSNTHDAGDNFEVEGLHTDRLQDGFLPDYYNHHDSWDYKSSGLRPKLSASVSMYDPSLLSNVTRPWENLCNGSLNRALNQLTCPRRGKIKNGVSNLLSVRPDVSCSMFDLKPYESVDFSDLGLRGSTLDVWGTSKQKCHPSKVDSKQRQYLNSHKYKSTQDLRIKSTISFQNKVKTPKSDRKCKDKTVDDCAEKPLKPAKYREFLSQFPAETIAQLNASLCKLDLSREAGVTAEEQSEERDYFAECTLPRRYKKVETNSMLRGNSLHMSFRMPKKKGNKI